MKAITRNVLALTLTGGLIVGLAACSPGSGSPEPSEAPVDKTLTLWGYSGDENLNNLYESYTDSEGYTVKFQQITATEYDTLLKTALASGSGPDLMMLRAYGGLESAVVGGGVEALSEDFAGLAKIPQHLRDGVTAADGKIYAVPDTLSVGATYYNKDIFAEYGLEAPTTWAELLHIEETLQANDVIPMAAGSLDSWVLPFYRDSFGASEYGGPRFADQLLSGETDFTNSQYTKANQVLLDQSAFFPNGSSAVGFNDALSLFTSGQAAMYPMATFVLGALQEALGDKLGVFTMPRASGTGAPYAMGTQNGGVGMSSELEGPRREAALRYLTWIGSAEFGQQIADTVKSIPAVDGVVPADPILAISTLAFAENPTPLLTFQHFNSGSPSGLDLEYDNLQKMLLGQITAEDVGIAVNTGVMQWFTPAKNG